MNNITDYQIFQRDLLLPVVLSCNRASGGNHRQQLLRGIPRPGFLDKPKCTGNKYHRQNYDDGKRSHILRCMLKDRYNNIGKNRYDCQAEQNCGKWIDKRPANLATSDFFFSCVTLFRPKAIRWEITALSPSPVSAVSSCFKTGLILLPAAKASFLLASSLRTISAAVL